MFLQDAGYSAAAVVPCVSKKIVDRPRPGDDMAPTAVAKAGMRNHAERKRDEVMLSVRHHAVHQVERSTRCSERHRGHPPRLSRHVPLHGQHAATLIPTSRCRRPPGTFGVLGLSVLDQHAHDVRHGLASASSGDAIVVSRTWNGNHGQRAPAGGGHPDSMG